MKTAPVVRSLRDAALAYAAKVWWVFPAHSVGPDGACTCGAPDCDNIGKHPLTARGHLDASKSRAQVEDWWKRWQFANIGVACGPSGLAVVDVDPRHGGHVAWNRLANQNGREILDTVRCRTGSDGLHFYYRNDPADPVRNSQGRIGLGVDTRGDGGYVIAPPSNHRSGNAYAWVAGRSPWEHRLLPFPSFLRERVGVRHQGRAEPVPERVVEGARHSTLVSLAGTMRARNFRPESIQAALMIENEARCDPPLGEREVLQIVDSILRYEPGGAAEKPWRRPPP